MERSGTFPKLNSPAASSGGGAYSNYYKAVQDAKANPAAYKVASSAISQAMQAEGVPDSWAQPLEELVAREASFNPNAKNPKSSARGLFQFLDGTRKDYGWKGVDWSNPVHQSVAGIRYIKKRYGDPVKALQFWDKNKWY